MSRMYRVIFGGLVLALAGSFGVSAWAKSPFWGCPVPQCPPSAPTPPAAAGEAATRTPGTEPAAPQAGEGAFAQAPAAGTGAESTGNPNMMGDFLPAGVSPFAYPIPSGSQSSSQRRYNRASSPSNGPFKIADNENVLPQDRFFLDYNGFSNILPGALNPKGISQVNYQYETAGFETSFLDGNASFGVRLPLIELSGKDFYQTRLGELSLVSKFLIASDGTGGDALSGGLVVTLPTGHQPTDLKGRQIHSTIWQPWWGAVTNLSDDWYFQGFNSLAVPSTREDATILFLDGAIGYWAYRGGPGGLITGIVPNSEIHINWVLTNRGEHNTSHAINVPSSIDLTEGVHIYFGRAVLQLGVSFCVTGPSLYDFEGIAQLNIPF